MFGNRRGISQTPFLIVTIILFLLACGMAYMQAQNKKKAEKRVRQRESEIVTLENNFRAKVEELEKICTATGYFETQGEDDVLARSETTITNDLTNKNKALSPPLTPDGLTCKKMLDELIRQIQWRDRQLDEKDLNLETKDNRINDEIEQKRRMVQEKDERIASLTEEHQRTLDRLNQTIQGFERQVTDLRERISSLSSDNERISEEKRAEVQKLNTEIGSLKARVLSLSKIEQIEETPMPDGRVIRADLDQGYAYIDLGSKDGVRAGQRFHVYSVLKGGRRRPKGQVRIIRVEKDFSQCSILTMSDVSSPIVMGDYIWNKFFVPGKKLIFVFVGKFGGEHVQYSREQLKKLVQAEGHIASDRVNPDAHYAVLGEDYVNDPQHKLVMDWRIEKIKPRDLFDHFGFGKFD